jgi:LPS export ABC transporter protein LptC
VTARAWLAAALALTACRHAAPAPPAASPPAHAARQAGAAFVPIRVNSERIGSKYIYVTKQKGNRKLYVLRADSESGEYLGAGTGRSDFVQPHITFFDGRGRQLVADAPAGTVIERDKSVVMRGGVTAHAQNGMTLSSDTMRYDDATETIHGDGHVVVTMRGGERLSGQRIDADLRLSDLHVAGEPGDAR